MTTTTIHQTRKVEERWLSSNSIFASSESRRKEEYITSNEERFEESKPSCKSLSSPSITQMRHISSSPVGDIMLSSVPKIYPQWVSLDSLYALSEEPIEGKLLVLARCKTRASPPLNPQEHIRSCTPGGLTWCQRQQSFFRLSWKSAYYSLSAGGVLRIYRSAQERSKSLSLGQSGENLAKWHSAISDAYVVSRIQELPERDAPGTTANTVAMVSKKRDYCGAFRQRCAALGPAPDEADECCEDGSSDNSGAMLSSATSSLSKSDRVVSLSSSVDDEELFLERSRFRTFELWLRNDISDPNACPVLKFAALAGDNDLTNLQEHLLRCCQRFHGPPRKPLRTFSHPLLRSCAGAVDSYLPTNYG
mmetsp:Transcript_20305/g.26307  ORF Transcript_20305/g.26307 Transcript_20305/m.26307 type:complete len:363 (+) Transcript_20305:115-1203(+)|eukprot:CAMPEP_0197318588 /NCGR_PEP_ID=MMETSP0891-20130614/51733_1 /TAXON_ID=44058 ORGANISM="Aureoumbra lagunensis, Strain CCMP1510" /NCGR_SAMPLE_ID=MMETSP0891 /ASSEMBLY_ACC=CAM_ASM_000534 /LENGTH=362 /DNA_ID=CAMNT_0042809133 /DNA_START=90 /DNA_END=1178 /DNA_ORIENTATION=+